MTDMKKEGLACALLYQTNVFQYAALAGAAMCSISSVLFDIFTPGLQPSYVNICLFWTDFVRPMACSVWASRSNTDKC